MGSTIEDIEFLARSTYRVDTLRELTREPCGRDTLRDATGASKATVARLLNELEDRNWVGRDGRRYELTDSGRFVAEAFIDLVAKMDTERTLRDVWQYLPHDLPGFTISYFDDAVVSFTEPNSPYQPIPRTVELIESAQTMRLFSERIPKPETLEVIMRNAAAGMSTELVFSAGIIQQIPREVPTELIEGAVDGGRLSILERETFPTDATLVLFDGRLGLYCRDEIGVTRLSIDTERLEAVTWGESIFEDVRAEARPVDLVGRVT